MFWAIVAWLNGVVGYLACELSHKAQARRELQARCIHNFRIVESKLFGDARIHKTKICDTCNYQEPYYEDKEHGR